MNEDVTCFLIGVFVASIVVTPITSVAVKARTTATAIEYLCAKESNNNLDKFKECVNRPAPWEK